MYPDWSCFELRASFFTAVFPPSFFQLCVMHHQTELHLTTLHPTGTMTVNLYQFELFIIQKPIHAKLSPHNALIDSELYPAACAYDFHFWYAGKFDLSSLTCCEVNVRLLCYDVIVATSVVIFLLWFLFCVVAECSSLEDCVNHLFLSEKKRLRHFFFHLDGFTHILRQMQVNEDLNVFHCQKYFHSKKFWKCVSGED